MLFFLLKSKKTLIKIVFYFNSAREHCSRPQATAPETQEENSPNGPNSNPSSASSGRPSGFLYQMMNMMNYMMNPDNIMENLDRDYTRDNPCPFFMPPVVPQGNQTPEEKPKQASTTPNIPVEEEQPNTDKAQEAKEKIPQVADEEKISGFESFYENLKPSVTNAVPLGVDANGMTTSVGVPAKEIEIQVNLDPVNIAEKIPVQTQTPERCDSEILREKLEEKISQMERDIGKKDDIDGINERSSSPTISYTSSEDSFEMNGRKYLFFFADPTMFIVFFLFKTGDKEWTVLDNDEEDDEETQKEDKEDTLEGAAARDMGAIPKQSKQDKATSTDSEASSMFGSAIEEKRQSTSSTESIEKKTTEAEKDQETPNEEATKPVENKEKEKTPPPPTIFPVTFEQAGRQLKEHLIEIQKLAQPTINQIVNGRYPHPVIPEPIQTQPNPSQTVYHPSE